MYYPDALSWPLPEGIMEDAYDVIFAGEVVDYLENPIAFLINMGRLMNSDTKLVITVPDAFNSEAFLHLLRGDELTHFDRNFYFSFRNLMAIARKAGFRIESYQMYHLFYKLSTGNGGRRVRSQTKKEISPGKLKKRVTGKIFYLISRLLMAMSPYYEHGHIVVLRLDEDAGFRSSRNTK